MTAIVGFAGFSIYEMENNWWAINLFAFCEGNKNDVSDSARLYFSGLSQIEIVDLIHSNFRERLKKKRERYLMIDGLLYIDISKDWISLEPTQPKAWENVEFDLVREIELVLRNSGVTVAREPEGRAFFRGTVIGS